MNKDEEAALIEVMKAEFLKFLNEEYEAGKDMYLVKNWMKKNGYKPLSKHQIILSGVMLKWLADNSRDALGPLGVFWK